MILSQNSYKFHPEFLIALQDITNFSLNSEHPCLYLIFNQSSSFFLDLVIDF